MATQIHVAGPVTIKIASPAAGTIDTLGLSQNGVDITEQKFTVPVHGDAYGGEQGPPIDIQHLGMIHIVRFTLTVYDSAILAKIRAVYAAATAGELGTMGQLAFQDTSAFRLLLDSTNASFERNYTRVVFREPQEINMGTIHSKAMCVAECHANASGVIYNSTMS